MDHLAPSGTTRVLEVQDYHWATAKQLQELEETWLISDDLGCLALPDQGLLFTRVTCSPGQERITQLQSLLNEASTCVL